MVTKGWDFLLEDGTKTDGVIGFSSIEALAKLSNINKDTVLSYNKVLEKEKILYIYRAKELMLIDNELSGITNTYGRYKYKKYVIGKGEEHKEEYGYDKFTANIKHKTKKTTERKSLGAKYFNLVSGNKMYDEQTIIDIYRYAVEYNRIHDVYSEMETYYKFITSGIIYSLHDLSVIRHSDSDFDGDIVLTTDSEVLIENAWDVMPTTYDKGVDNMTPKKYDIKVAVESDKQGFGNKVGVYSNLSTSLFAMMPLFAEGDRHTDVNYPEYDCTEKQLELYKTIKKDRFIIGEEIDSTKTGVKPEMSSDFIYTNYRQNMEEIRRMNQDGIEKFSEKLRTKNELVPKFMPYFFIYNRDSYKDKYTKYKTKMNEMCKWYTYESIDNFVYDMMHGIRQPETKNEKFFWEYFVSHCPLLLTDCLMNKICWKLEMFEDELEAIMKSKWSSSENYILMGYAKDDITLSKKQEQYIREKYDEYKNEIMAIFNKKNTNNGDKKLYQVGKRDALIFRLRTEMTKELGVGFTELFHMLVKALKKESKSKYNVV